MKAVNLLPADHKQVRSGPSLGSRLAKHQVAIGTAAATLAVGAALVVVYQDTSKTVTSRQTQLTSLQARAIAVVKPTNTPDQTVRDRLTQISQTDATRVSWDGFMSNLARVLPEDVWLTGMQIAEAPPAVAGATSTPANPNPAPVATGAPTGFSITGYTYSQRSVARLMRRLRMLPWLNQVSLQNSNVATVGTHSAFQFTIVGGVNSLPAKEAS